MAAIVLDVRVKPRARLSSLVQQPDGTWVACVTSPPIEGQANRELVELVAAYFKCPKGAVTILSGKSGRRKRVRAEVA